MKLETKFKVGQLAQVAICSAGRWFVEPKTITEIVTNTNAENTLISYLFDDYDEADESECFASLELAQEFITEQEQLELDAIHALTGE